MNLYFQLFVLMLTGWINRRQQSVIDYLQAENRALHEQLGPKRIRWTDGQRRKLADKAYALGRDALKQIETVVTPETLFRWYRKLVAAKYDGSAKRGRDALGVSHPSPTSSCRWPGTTQRGDTQGFVEHFTTSVMRMLA